MHMQLHDTESARCDFEFRINTPLCSCPWYRPNKQT